FLTRDALVELTVQPGARLVRQQMQREALHEWTTQPFLLLVPRRMPHAVGIAEAGDRLREDLNSAGRGSKRVLVRIRAKPLEDLHAIGQERPKVQRGTLSEGVERGQRDARRGGILTSDIPEMLDPLLRRAPLRELRLESQPHRKPREDRVVVP